MARVPRQSPATTAKEENEGVTQIPSGEAEQPKQSEQREQREQLRQPEQSGQPEQTGEAAPAGDFPVLATGTTLVGRYEITQRATVLDAVALAGGFNDWARRSKLVIMRHDGNTVKRIPVNYNRIVAEEDENVFLQPGDIVVVP